MERNERRKAKRQRTDGLQQRDGILMGFTSSRVLVQAQIDKKVELSEEKRNNSRRFVGFASRSFQRTRDCSVFVHLHAKVPSSMTISFRRSRTKYKHRTHPKDSSARLNFRKTIESIVFLRFFPLFASKSKMPRLTSTNFM